MVFKQHPAKGLMFSREPKLCSMFALSWAMLGRAFFGETNAADLVIQQYFIFTLAVAMDVSTK